MMNKHSISFLTCLSWNIQRKKKLFPKKLNFCDIFSCHMKSFSKISRYSKSISCSCVSKVWHHVILQSASDLLYDSLNSVLQ